MVQVRRMAGSDIVPLVHVALDSVLLGNSCISWRGVRGVIANLQRLENLVEQAEAELADL